jgi:hypothetical protein
MNQKKIIALVPETTQLDPGSFETKKTEKTQIEPASVARGCSGWSSE